jgi:hypothetical protein
VLIGPLNFALSVVCESDVFYVAIQFCHCFHGDSPFEVNAEIRNQRLPVLRPALQSIRQGNF